MSLISRVSLKGNNAADEEDDAADILSSAIGVIFPDDMAVQHGDAEHSVVYTSPHFRKPLHLELAVPTGETERTLFSHYLWNSSLVVAELLETDSLLGTHAAEAQRPLSGDVSFDVSGRSVLEFGAGTGLPSITAANVGAARVAATDYPSPAVIEALRGNVTRNTGPQIAPDASKSTASASVVVTGHEWGVFTDEFARSEAHAFDRVVSADCLWMARQHDSLRRTISHFLGLGPDARAWIVAQFHTGREKAASFFDAAALADVGLEIDRIWERDFNGLEREWAWETENEYKERKFWTCVCVLRRKKPN